MIVCVVWKLLLKIMNKNDCFSCLGHGYFFVLRGKSFVSVAYASSRDFLVSKHVMKMTHALGLDMANFCQKKIAEDKTDLMLARV